ncbi:MAG: hypothetical protein JNL88_07605, partial [Bacteroidia bacterium]|nr:hypothetical protein [Bacteroidia bacterium]
MSHRNRFIVSFCFAVLFIFIYGYQFNNGDQEEHLPYVYKLLQPELYSNDYLVPKQTATFTIRYYYAHLLQLGGRMLPLPTLVFLLHLGCLMIVGWSVSSLADSKGLHPLAGITAPMLLLAVNGFTTGGNNILDIQFTCSVPAMAAGSLALLYTVRKKPVVSFSLCGIASLFQVLMGLHLFILLLAWHFFQAPHPGQRLKTLLHCSLCYLVFAGPMLFPLLLQQYGPGAMKETPFYHELLFRYRNAHHYLVECFPLKDYLKTAAWWALILFAVRRLSHLGEYRLYSLFIVLTALACFTYAIGFGVFHLTALGKLQCFKATIWPGLLGTVPVSRWLGNLFSISSRSIRRFFLIAPGLSIVLLLLICNSASIPWEKFRSRYKVGNYAAGDLERMHLWISEHTGLHERFITLPGDDSFLCEARRSLVVGYKAILHRP